MAIFKRHPSLHGQDKLEGQVGRQRLRSTQCLRLMSFISPFKHAMKFDDDHLAESSSHGQHIAVTGVLFDDENGESHDKTIADLFPLPERKNLTTV